MTQNFGQKSILDPSFRYTSSGATDLRKTFARIRREQRAKARAPEAAAKAHSSAPDTDARLEEESTPKLFVVGGNGPWN